MDLFQYNSKYYIVAPTSGLVYIGIANDGVNFTLDAGGPVIYQSLLLEGTGYRVTGMWIGSDFYVYYSTSYGLTAYSRVYRVKINFI
jgi:hypothetical protein